MMTSNMLVLVLNVPLKGMKTNQVNIFVEKLFGYNKEAIFVKSKDPEYLTNNPNRRCPNIDKARKLLYYKPKVSLSQGIKRFLIYNS